MYRSIIPAGYLIAGIMNIGGILLFSQFFTSTALNQADPVVMSNFGLLMIMVWGLAYIAASGFALQMRWLALVFALEKLIYVGVWLRWLNQKSDTLAAIYQEDFLAGVFYSVYGINDFVFMVFFVFVFFRAREFG